MTDIVKIIMCGAQKVGKSSILQALHNDFDEEYLPTNMSDFTSKDIVINHTTIALQVWDIGDASDIGRSCLRGCRGVVLVVDMASKHSLEKLCEMYDNIVERAGFIDDSFTCAIFGNKIDMLELPETTNQEEMVTLEDLQRWADDRRKKDNVSSHVPIQIFQITAKNSMMVTNSFIKLTETILSRPNPTTQNITDCALSSNNIVDLISPVNGLLIHENAASGSCDDILLETPQSHPVSSRSQNTEEINTQQGESMKQKTKSLKVRSNHIDKERFPDAAAIDDRLMAHRRNINEVMSGAFKLYATDSDGISATEGPMSPLSPPYNSNQQTPMTKTQSNPYVHNNERNRTTVESLTTDQLTAKVIITGAPCAGKTLLLNRYLQLQSPAYSVSVSEMSTATTPVTHNIGEASDAESSVTDDTTDRTESNNSMESNVNTTRTAVNSSLATINEQTSITADEELVTHYQPTIGANFRETCLKINEQKVVLHIWDCGGDFLSQQLGKATFKFADCLLLVFDLTNRSSFDSLDLYWDNYIKFSGASEEDEFPVLLVGNKCDCAEEERQTTRDEVLAWCARKRPESHIKYSECSALKNVNVDAVMHQASQLIHDYFAIEDDEQLLNLDDQDALGAEEQNDDKKLTTQTPRQLTNNCDSQTPATSSGMFVLVDPDESSAAAGGCMERNCWLNTTFCNLL